MAKVPLDGLRIEVSHQTPPDQVTAMLEEFAEDLAQNKFQEWGVTIDRQEDGRIQLAGRRGETHFDAYVQSEPGRAVVTLEGSVELSILKLTLAGGADGVRKRVRDEITRTLEDHLT